MIQLSSGFLPLPPNPFLWNTGFILQSCNVNHVFKANQMLFATKTLWHSRLFLNYGHIPASAEFVNRPNLLFPGFMHISLKALDMPSSAPFIGILLKFSFSLGCVQCTRGWYPWNGGIDQCCWNVLLLFLCVLYVWILFHGGSCYPSSLWQHHLSLQRPVCTQIFFLRGLFVCFRSVRGSTSLRSKCLRYITYVHFSQDCGTGSLKRKWRDPSVFLSASTRIN